MEPMIFTYEAMGTHWKITIWDTLAPDVLSEIQQSIIQQSKEFNQAYSRFFDTSFITKLSTTTGIVAVPTDFMAMLKLYMKLYRLSGKKFNPLIGNTISDLGYDADYSLMPKATIRPTPDLDTAVKIIDDQHIELQKPVLFDLGALGKGYFVDKIATFLKSKNLQRFLVDGSGDISYTGNGVPIRAGLEHPGDTSKAIGVITMTEGALCGSASNRRRWQKYHHIIDPQTLTSPEDIIATWVYTESAAVADGLATCLFLADPEPFTKVFQFEYCILNKDYKIKRSANFQAELF